MRDKDTIRQEVWSAMVREGAYKGGRSIYDRIPDFHGTQEAAERIFALPSWQSASVVKSNPDQPQRPLRRRALEEGKIVYMAVPRLREEECFVELDPAVLQVSPAGASTIAGAFRHGRLVTIEEMRPVDLVVSGSVAVNRSGTRIGKGGGYADLEYGLAAAAGIVGPDTPVVTTVHTVQLLDEELPWTYHDVPLSYVATPQETILCDGELPRPTGIYWEDLDQSKIDEIPVLIKLQAQR
ncbi:MAG: 5-formyltetrahydrofolate cyclo-ligase [Dehalococcoidia bacterium]|nr:5-formyltetrahydrofolate cyclo-ligase [Dehalococcoidia bacterium]